MSLAQLVSNIVRFTDTFIVPSLYALAFLFFVYGIFKYFFTQNEKEREKGRDFVVWSLVGFVIMFSVWGIIHLMLNTINTVPPPLL